MTWTRTYHVRFEEIILRPFGQVRITLTLADTAARSIFQAPGTIHPGLEIGGEAEFFDTPGASFQMPSL
jgi:hypothetical protein